MTRKQYKQWLIERLAEIEDREFEREATAREADIVFEAKCIAYDLELYDLAKQLPERPRKTQLDCCLRLRECLDYLEHLENPPAAPVDDDALLSLKEAATFLNYKPEGLRAVVKQGRIQFSKNGERGHYKFRRSWLEEFLRTQGGGPESLDRSPAQSRPMPIGFDLRPSFDPSFFQSDS
jgi:excisionase family DNA binding protein